MIKRTYILMPVLAAASIVGLALPEGASAQETAGSTTLMAAVPSVVEPTVSFTTTADWKAYAVALEREAAGLPAGSAESLSRIRTAAMIRLNFGEAATALDMIVGAAEAAESTGSVALAAHTFIDGAWIASEMKIPSTVNQLAERAIMLTISPLMGDADRVAVLRRVERATPSEMAAR